MRDETGADELARTFFGYKGGGTASASPGEQRMS